ncbi:hypothetical protein NESM_000531000 [Novymonas esmeraldas]|uniref:Digestive organ expansion factor-like protein n=1 Tax=Novymonas esmeraldas TaxID=1808958 RepID=A0AAW0EPG9_9TRYP
MGRPGGFFKKLKAKEKRASSRKQRGTKGASKEDRQRKHNERVEVYAARREAEQLANVSSSSDDEPSTDSDAEEYRRTTSLRKLQRLLGTTARAPSAAAALKRRADAVRRSADGGAAAAAAAAATKTSRRRRRRPRHESSGGPAAVDDDTAELDGEDWRLYLGDASGSDEDGDDAESELAAAELGAEMDDADDVVDADLLADVDEEEDEEEEEEEDGAGANPLFDLANGDDEGDDDDGAELFADATMMYDGGVEEEEEEEDEEEEEREEAFVDEDSDGEDGEDGAAPAQERLLLQRCQLHTSSLSSLQLSGVLGTATSSSHTGSTVLTDADEWARKYHLDLHGTVDESPLTPVPVSHAALELLAASNRPLQERAAERLRTTTDKKELGIFFVSPEDYAAVHPENVAVLASASAQQHLSHAPFEVQRSGAASASSAAAPPWTACPAYLHPVLWEKWESFRTTRGLPTFTVEERGVLDMLQTYADLLDTLHCWQNSESRREIFALHTLNHWFKAKSVVLAHDALLAKRREARRRRRVSQRKHRGTRNGASDDADEQQRGSTRTRGPRVKGTTEASATAAAATSKAKSGGERGEEEEEEEEEEELELRDRGFSKTRVCVVCPLRNHAYKFVYTIVSILQADPARCPKLAMFEQDFTEIEEAVDPTFRRRPRDYQRSFEGNIDDSFCVGLRLEPARVHVYTHPLNSDVLLCSPLGLRRRIEKNGDVLVSLSSIEVCLLEDAQMLYQQNWAHVTAVLELLNKRPTDTTHGLSDLRRVYAWALEGRSGRHRQTVLSTDVCNATMLATFRTTSVNNSGKMLLQRRVDPGVLSRVLVPVRQHFIRFDPASLATVDDDRFHFFTKQMYESKINAMAERDVRVIIFVPSYFDFVRLRNYLHREYRESYVALSEYTSLSQQRKALGQFSDLERPVLLVTERFYYFKRYFVKLAEALVLYSPPMFPEYYASLANRLAATSPNAFTMTLYCRYDTHELNRLVGTSRMVQLLQRESGVFSFVTS